MREAAVTLTGHHLRELRGPQRQRGLSLVELVLVLIISAVFVSFTGTALMRAVSAYNQVSPTLAAQAQLRHAVDRISRELREVRLHTTNNPKTYDFTTPAAPNTCAAPCNRVVFVKNDGTTVTIDGSSGTAVNLSYSSPAATGRLADIAATNALTFAFRDHSTNGTTASTGYRTYSAGTANLGAVEFTLTVTVDGVATSATTRVSLRGNTQ